MKLLYAEDEMSMSEAVVDILTFHKYIVDAVYDGADSREKSNHRSCRMCRCSDTRSRISVCLRKEKLKIRGGSV